MDNREVERKENLSKKEYVSARAQDFKNVFKTNYFVNKQQQVNDCVPKAINHSVGFPMIVRLQNLYDVLKIGKKMNAQ